MTTNEKQKLRNKAQRYAVAFLMQKYRTEYKELLKDSRVVRTAPDGSLFLGDN
jgi:hypothetical protein